jgi:FSR family fosmidomycin resistance protein-like MFS transporter
MRRAGTIELPILWAICLCHLINDMLQSLLGASYPTLVSAYHLSFAQVGMITLAYQLTASLLQPLVGLCADRRPAPLSLPSGPLFTFTALLVLSLARGYPALLAGACILGVGSSLFHPESSRVARMASGGRDGLAQSLFQVGGVVGGSLGPIGAVLVVLRWGQRGMGLFASFALVAAVILGRVAVWYRRHGLSILAARTKAARAMAHPALSAGRVGASVSVLLVLIFSKYVYLASISSYYTFFLIQRFGVSVRTGQLLLFVFLASAALGTLVGGPVGDRFGRKQVIWCSILGVLPFTVAMTRGTLFWTVAASIVVGFVLSSAFPAIVVYGYELITDRVGLVAGLFYGFSFGAAGLGAAALGRLADATSMETVFRVCAFLPAIGVVALLLPDLPGAGLRASSPGPRAEEAPPVVLGPPA